MVYLIVLIVLSFLVLVFYLVHKIKADTARFNAKIKVLEDFIIHISKEQTIQNNPMH
jgi:hypothetical protein